MGEAKLRRARRAANPLPPRPVATDMGPVMNRLRHIEAFLIAPDYVLLYARYLAEVMRHDLIPMGFLVATEIARDELRRDYRGPDELPVPTEYRSLVGGNPSLYEMLRIYVPKIAEAVCPPDFAEEVVRLHRANSSATAAAVDELLG